ncbi:MAG TPA: hypothetical protein VF988_04105 [Verrucomicrobiae bacterium]
MEPVDNQMPFTVNCPICKRDGTAKANQMLQQMSVFKPVDAAPAAAAAPQPSASRITVKPPAPPLAAPVAAVAAPAPAAARPHGRPMGAQMPDRAQVETEARAKILWGDAREEVIMFMMLRGIPRDEASELVGAMLKERRRTIRAKGIAKTVGGVITTCGAGAAIFAMLRTGFFSPFVLGGVGLAAVGGLWMIFNGVFKVIAPSAASGDASEND